MLSVDRRPALRLLSRVAAIFLASLIPAAATAADLPTELARLDAGQLELASVHAAVADIGSGAILYRKNADRQVPIASVTKLMTALTVLESGEPLDEWLTVHERREPPPNNAYSRIRTDSRLRRGDLLRLALMSSENLAAYNLARHHPGGLTDFVAEMNANARALGMTRSEFVGPSGLAEGNRSTAADLTKLLLGALGYDVIREYTQTGSFTARFREPRYTLPYGNTNPLVRRDNWEVAVTKTGYLDVAGRCLAMVAQIGDRQIAMVLLDSFGKRSPLGDAGRIRDWIETGDGGTVAGPARKYEQRKSAAYTQPEGAG